MALARSACARAPGNPALHLALARALAGAGELGEAQSVLSGALSRLPDHEPLHEELAYVLARRGEVEVALACARGRDAPWASTFAFKLLVRQGRRSETEALEPAVAAFRPADPDLLESGARRCRDDPERLLRLCEEALSHEPGAAHALYYKAVALAVLGRGDEAAALMALDRFLGIGPLPAPPGFGGDEAFSEEVRREILANPSLHSDPAGHATRSGLRTATFPAAGDRASAALVGAIRAAVDSYAAGLSGDHPFVRARPARAIMTQWALVFRGAGRQLPHHHPGCWLTGVYYVSALRDSPRPGAPFPGVIRIGGLPDWAGVEPPWPRLEIQPVPGTLLLFPSFVPHETVAPGAGAERISVAFDVSAEGR
ncbi:MAG TPA: putative 2OG-Fe(II) oxygenase [Allosphingosinicella sp.]|nr:putative 2OG-Fe(II) oxygenase [Allosphingosinicella sp.]